MFCFSRTLLATSISAALAGFTYPVLAASDALQNNIPNLEQCLVDIPDAQSPDQLPINVEADQLEAINGDRASYSGNVVVIQGKKQLTADKVTLYQQDNTVIAHGNVNFSDGQFHALSDKVTSNLTTDAIQLEQTQYQFLCEPGRGEASYIAKTGKAVYEMKDGSLTSCPIGDNAWRLVASSIDVDQNEEQAIFYHPRLEVLNVPVFYLPFLSVPIGDTRKTGFLYPTLSYGSRHGFEFETPFYWNLAPNYDLSTTVHYMEKRGTRLNGEFRYLTDFGLGSIKGEYLPEDSLSKTEHSRWAFQYKHSGLIAQSWKLETDYSRASDVDYFSDLSSSIGNKEDGQLIQQGRVSYRSKHWDTSLLVRDFQVLTQTQNLPYRIMPQVNFNLYFPETLPYLDVDLKSHVTRFETSETNRPSATRVHIEPGFKIPLSTTWGSWTNEVRVLNSYYQQDLRDVALVNDYQYLEETTLRTIPEFRSHAGIVLERDTVLLSNYTQTLEPQIQYLYVPKKEQNTIAWYDTTLMQTDYYGLFRSRKYSSVDYVAPANQLSYGAATRFFDSKYKERLNIAFGQIFYLDKELKTSSYSLNEKEKSSYSAWAVEVDFNYDDAIFYHGGVQYDIDTGSMQLANNALEYRFDDGFIQTNYRYVSREYIEDTVGNTIPINSITKKGISQAGLLSNYQLSPKWHLSGQYFYDLTTQHSLEWLASLNYRSDCWYIGFTYSNQLKGWKQPFDIPNPSFSDPEYESNFSFNVGIIGFGSNFDPDSKKALNSLGYGRPFILNN